MNVNLNEKELEAQRCRREKAEELVEACVDAMAQEWEEDKENLNNFRIRMFNYFYGEFERYKMSPEMMESWIQMKIAAGLAEEDDY